MDEKKYTITLADGAKLENLRLNGTNFVSKAPISEDVFKNNLATVLISVDGKSEVSYDNLALVQITQVDSDHWFVLRELTQQEIEQNKLRLIVSDLSDTIDALLISMLEGDD